MSPSPSSPVTATRTAASPSVWRYHYDRNGNRTLAQEAVPVTELGHTRKASYDPTSNAMRSPASGREYVWNAQGRLIGIRQENRELARYRYNHHGLRVGKQTETESTHTLYNEQRQRIADLDSQGRITRQYVWLADQLIATLDANTPKALQAPAEGFLAELSQTAQALWNAITGNTDRLAFVHVNHLGAPIAATDEEGQVLWQADYAPYGQVIKVGAVRAEFDELLRTRQARGVPMIFVGTETLNGWSATQFEVMRKRLEARKAAEQASASAATPDAAKALATNTPIGSPSFAAGDVLVARIARVKLLAESKPEAKVLGQLGKHEEVIYLGETDGRYLKVRSAEGEGWADQALLGKP